MARHLRVQQTRAQLLCFQVLKTRS